MLVALVSLNQLWHKKEENFLRCKELAQTAVDKGAELIIFPEMTLTGYSLDTELVPEEIASSKTLEKFAVLSEELHCDILFGAGISFRHTERPHNVLCHAGWNSGARPVYSKIHPFSVVGEDEVYEAGESLNFIGIKGIKLGASICYDLRFPELFSQMALQCVGAICIANWPSQRIEHWHVLLKARAIENQMFLIGVNRVGVDGLGVEYIKSSRVISPTGESVGEVFKSLELDIFDIDFNTTQEARDEFPILKDRYPVYSKFLQKK